MRDCWYGDNRDLVKWGVLLELARRYRARHILQVAFLRPCGWARLEIDGEGAELPSCVLDHFRQTTSITGLRCDGVKVEIVADPFTNRQRYLETVLARIRSRQEKPGVVFLDPDTGLQPRKSTLAHVLESELKTIWATLHPRDLLVFYQHQTNRSAKPWINDKKAQFARALAITERAAGVARAPKIARDVVFFFSLKPEPPRKGQYR